MPTDQTRSNTAKRPRIVATAGTCAGFPRLNGTRMPVATVLGALMALGSYRAVREVHPYVSDAEIDACLKYAIKLVEKQRDK